MTFSKFFLLSITFCYATLGVHISFIVPFLLVSKDITLWSFLVQCFADVVAFFDFVEFLDFVFFDNFES